jgi:hypothetical protein
MIGRICRWPITLHLILGILAGWAIAYKDPYHRRHACPSDRNTYVCGDLGRCEQCLDNQYCFAGEPRTTSSTSPTPAPPASRPREPTRPIAVSACFTPGGNGTDLIVKASDAAKTSILVQASRFPSATIAKALVDAHKRGLGVQVILVKSQRTEQYSSADFLAN